MAVPQVNSTMPVIGASGFAGRHLAGAGRPVTIGSGRRRFRMVAVEDLADYLVDVLDDPRSIGQHYGLGSDDVLTTDQMTRRGARSSSRSVILTKAL